MGESSACLVRSFSQPSPTSEEEKKRNPIDRALTASVSFGRFMSESLDWGKWSAFNNNRYLDEVERYTKPGSVAAKKAYFEAHFKRRRAAKLLEQQNVAACTGPETENAENKIEDNSSIDFSHVQGAEIPSSIPIVPSGKSGDHDDTSVKRTMGDSKPGETAQAMATLAEHLKDDVCISDTVSTKEDNTCIKDDVAIRNLAAGGKIPRAPSAKMLTEGVASISKRPPSVEPIVPDQANNSDKSPPESKRSSSGSSNKRRSYMTSLHMSINLASCPGMTQNDTSSGLPKIENPKVIRAPAKKYKNSALPQTSTRGSVNGLIKQFSVAPTAENRRTVRPHGDSIPETKTTDEKVQSPFAKYPKSSNLFGNKARLPTVPSSFTFKSEERAVKRREFFLMLEQKTKSKEKHQVHARPQATGRNSNKDAGNSITLETSKAVEAPLRNVTKKATGRNSDKDAGNSITLETSKAVDAPLRNITKKIPTARPFFPKIEERAAAFKVQESNIVRPPWKFSANTEGSKGFTAKNSRTPSHSTKCQPKKIMNENACPNIQL
ncbi:protein WVD2-like 7 [Salvia splendens]|uniref:protein WVD2-like 7 n=1 Tax=Salvia splendens TaxID=180675 RepID=UPI001C26CCE5|nr:protein WVD2-like 7 [Salvia splendens]